MRKFQSTHPRGVRRGTEGRIFRVIEVSIHAPAWGATSVSISATSTATRFQSTHPRGVRPGLTGHDAGQQRVSIHAPAWGATRSWRGTDTAGGGFNPRTRVGCDTAYPWPSMPWPMFQSTHPRGVRRNALGMSRRKVEVSIHAPAWGATVFLDCKTGNFYGFNPRTRVGCDRKGRASPWQCYWFQSTHPRGVRHAFPWSASRGW